MKAGLMLFLTLLPLSGCRSTVSAPGEEAVSNARFLWDIWNDEERAWLSTNERGLESEAQRIEESLGAGPVKQVTVRVRPVEERKALRQCSQTDGPTQIHVHSPTSLSQGEAAGVDPACRSKPFSALFNTVLHEYVHVLQLRLNPKAASMPAWIREGTAQYLSGEQGSEHHAMAVRKALAAFPGDVAVCEISFTGTAAEELGAAVLRHYEKLQPGVLKELNRLGSDAEARTFLASKGLPCRIPRTNLSD